MKKFEVMAYSLEEAKEKAQDLGIIVTTNVTQSWKNAKCPISDKDFKTFAVEMLEKKRLSKAEGVGLIIAVDAGSKDTRERPYKFVNNVVEGKRNTKRVIEIRSKATGELFGEAENKGKAEKLAKDIMVEKCEDMVAEIVYRVQEGKDIAFELKYAPSKSAKEGRYIVFGNEKQF